MSTHRTRPRATKEAAVEQAVEQTVELTIIARQAGIRIALAHHYLDFELFNPCTNTSETPLFAPTYATRLAKAKHLHQNLSLNYAGTVLVCKILDRIREL